MLSSILEFLTNNWYIIVITGLVIDLIALFVQYKQPRKSMWGKILVGIFGGTIGGLVIFGTAGMGIAMLGTAIGLPIFVVTGVFGGMLGLWVGRNIGTNYGGKWQKQINIFLSLGTGLTILGLLVAILNIFL